MMKETVKEKADKVLNIDVQSSSSLDEAMKQVEVSVQFKQLEANRTAQDSKFTTVRYPISIYLSEATGSHKGKAVVPFTIEAKTDPEIAVFTLKGDVYIRGSPEEIEPWVIPKGEKAPRIWTRIYREGVAMLTILSRFINVPPPPPPPSEE